MGPTLLLLVWLVHQASTSPVTSAETPPDKDSFPSPTVLSSGRSYAFADSDDLDVNATLACDETNAPGRWVGSQRLSIVTRSSRHMIYCSGKLLHAVMATHVYPDSKTFVDRPMKRNRTGQAILEQFLQRFPMELEAMNRDEIIEFVEEHFEPEGQELLGCELKDWQDNPLQIASITDGTFRQFALELHGIWKQLCRRVDPIVAEESERFSLIPVPHPFIAPGGRFRENYYWDTYWIIKGLLVSGMTETVRGIILNFAQMVEVFGFVPNGGRIYYLERSQPPMLAPMVYEYYQATKDKELLKDMLPILERELNFWRQNRSVDVTIGDETLSLFQYRTPLKAPRPESYREDMMTAKGFETIGQKRKFFQNLASAAESGWDFSTRWLREKSNLASIETTSIVPVDLNAFICYNMQILTYFHSEAGNVNKQFKWMSDYLQFRDNFKKVFYVQKAKGWYDYNLNSKEHNLDFYPSMAVPLFTQCYDHLNTKMFEEVYDKMNEMGAFNFTGGVPTSLRRESHQQWDFPNGWSPLNHMIIEGLRKSNNPKLQQKAFELAEKWVNSNLNVFLRERQMWEKYNVVSTRTLIGNGGEYQAQAGFGWTNGVILDLLNTYSDRLRFPDGQPPIVPVPVQFRREHLPKNGGSGLLPSLLAFSSLLLTY